MQEDFWCKMLWLSLVLIFFHVDWYSGYNEQQLWSCLSQLFCLVFLGCCALLHLFCFDWLTWGFNGLGYLPNIFVHESQKILESLELERQGP